VKKISIQIKIGLLMILAVSLLTATGYLSYRNLSSIVSSIQFDLKPDARLLSIREISMDLEKAQNSIRIYTSTHDSIDLRPYRKITSNINEKVTRLQAECLNDSILRSQTDTIGKLIEKNILIWNQLLNLNNSYKFLQDLKQLSGKLDSSSVEERKNENNILNRVFSRTTKNRLTESEIKHNLREIEKQDSVAKIRLTARETRLAVTSTEIKEKFYDLISRIENEISVSVKNKAVAADELAAKTYIGLAMFSVSGTILAILVILIVIRYVRKTQIYQVALQHSKDEAERLAKTKELFMANMSHEIRTPVTAITGFTEQLLHNPLDENTLRSLKIIKSSSDHLARIINDILDFSKLQNGKLTLEKVHFSIAQILEEVYSLFENQAQRNNTKLSFSISPDTPEILLGDPHRLRQILMNLVSNAVKFTKNGKVHFNIYSAKKQSDMFELILEVNDNGIGIDENKIDFIFEDFTQEEMSTTRKYGGTGLGLSIVKKLVELHGGTLECISRKNQGTKITCHIPYQTGDEKLVKKEIEPSLFIPEEIRNLKVLVVDDEDYNRLLFKTILSRWNVKHREAVNGMEALEILKSEKFDMVFMDARMPGIDGLKATQFIRNDMNISAGEMPVICISAAPVNDDKLKFSQSGMNAFLSKPFTEEMLLTTILSVIKDYVPASSGNAPNVEEMKATSGVEKINLDNLYHISGGDKQFVKQMLVSFIESTGKGLKSMIEESGSGNNDSVGDLAHKLLPPCRHIGALELTEILRKIEESVRKKNGLENIKDLVQASSQEFEIISELIRQHIAKIS
jgi:signal transduction histidine kinase/FixJ family two-component response regulator/HPt (histidine-containing phosphotransfer) domain-containing protein